MENLMDAESQSTEDKITPTEQTPIATNPNSVLLTFSWGFFGVGSYLLYWAISGWYGESRAEGGQTGILYLTGRIGLPARIVCETVGSSRIHQSTWRETA